jgi:hypothetical protein
MVLVVCTMRFSPKSMHYIYGIYVILTTNSDYFCVQHSSISLSNGSTLCSLKCEISLYTYCRLVSVFKGLNW